jgi:uncharacterized membrane protein YfcA
LNGILLLSGAIAAGFAGGFLGLGGGVILVPFLTLAANLPMHQAVALSLATIMANSLVSSTAYIKRGLVDFRFIILLSTFASIGAVAGSYFGGYIPNNYLQISFAILMAYTTWSLLRKKDSTIGHKTAHIRPRTGTVIAMGLLTGVISSALGVGGGFIIVPVAYLIFDYSMDLARGSSMFAIGIIATAGSVVYFMQGTLNIEYAGIIMLGTIAGGWAGSHIGLMVKTRVVKSAFALLLIYLAVKMFLEGIS